MGKSKYDVKRPEVEALIAEKITVQVIAEKTGIPLGTVPWLLQRWGLESARRQGSHFSEAGAKLVSEKLAKRHATDRMPRGKEHWAHGKRKVRGTWVPKEECRAELERYVEKDLTRIEMAEALGACQRQISVWLKEFGLQQGIRSGKRCSWYKGGWIKTRGPDWFEVRERILERDGYKCVRCGMTQEEARARGHTLSIHHKIPWEVSHDNADSNLETLDQSCHMKEEWATGRWSAEHQ